MKHGSSASLEPPSHLQPVRHFTPAILFLSGLLGLAVSPVLPTVYPETEESVRAAAAAERERHHLREQLDRMMNFLGDPRVERRGDMAATFANLGMLHPDVHPDIRAFANWLSRDPDREVARWGETLAARLDGREPDPEIAPPYQPTPAELRQRRERWQALLARAASTTGERRRNALRQIVDTARREHRLADAELRSALEAALDDPSSRVSQFARFMLRGIDGDPHAFGMVFSRGESKP